MLTVDLDGRGWLSRAARLKSQRRVAERRPASHLGRMIAHSFTVEQRQVPGEPAHYWVAIDDDDGSEIPLYKGGTGAWLGRYPEIADYLASKSVQAALDYTPRRGDRFDPDYEKDEHRWTFETGGGIVVKDIPRLVWEMSIRT